MGYKPVRFVIQVGDTGITDLVTSLLRCHPRLGPALEAHRRLLLWLIPTLEKFPRSQRFLLGDRIETAALDCLERLIEATYTRERRAPLRARPI